MICTACTQENTSSSLLCHHCGARLPVRQVIVAPLRSDAMVPVPSAADSLVVVLPDSTRVTVAGGESLRIGRDSPGALGAALAGESRVSRAHAEIECAGVDSATVVDLGSSNGTFLDGRRLAPGIRESIRPGDRIRLGRDVELRLDRGE